MKNYLRFFKPHAFRKGVLVGETPYIENKNLLKFVEDHYKCAQAELYYIPRKKKKRYKHLTKLRLLKRFTSSDEVPPGFFLTIIFSIQGSIHDITKYLNAYTYFGVWLAWLLFSLIYIFIAMPLYMVFFFLSNYTRKSYVKIWLAVPILKGVGLSVAMLNIVSCILNMTLVSLQIIFFYASFANWFECDYPYEAGTECIPISTNNTSFCTEANSTMPQFGSYVFLKHVTTSTFGDNINLYWIGVVLVVYGMVIFGELYSRIVLAPICKVTSVMWGIIFTFIIFYECVYGTNYSLIFKTSTNWGTLLKPMFWISCSKVALTRVMPGDLVTYGSITMAGMSPITMAVLMSLMRIIFTTTVANLYVISLNFFIENHGIKYTDCIEVNGLTILYCFIPEQLIKADPSKFYLFVYLFTFTYMGAMSTFLSINGFLTAITGDYPETKNYRNAVVVLICFIMCVFNVLVIGLGFEFLLFQEMKIIIAPFITYACVAFFISSYSPLRIANDFYFSYGLRLSICWNVLLKLFVIYVSTISVLHIIFDIHLMQIHGSFTANIIAMVLIVVPVVVYAAIRVYSAKKHTNISFIAPDQEWGDPNPVVRAERVAFDAKRECRMEIESTCHHECLVGANIFENYLSEEIVKFTKQRDLYLALMLKRELLNLNHKTD